MRRLLNILMVFVCSIIIILALAFIFLEGRLIFSLDWIVYDNNVNGLIRYLFRLLLAVIVIIVAALEIVNIKKNNRLIGDYLLFAEGGLVVAAIVIMNNTTNYIDYVSIALASVLYIIKLGLVRENKK